MSYVGEKLTFEVRKGLWDQTKEKIFLHTSMRKTPNLTQEWDQTGQRQQCTGDAKASNWWALRRDAE